MADEVTEIPILAVKKTLLFPQIELSFIVGRPKSVEAIKECQKNKTPIVVIAQKDSNVIDPHFMDLYSYGCKGVIKKVKEKSHGFEVLVLGQERVLLEKITGTDPFLQGNFKSVPLPTEEGPEFVAIHRTIFKQINELQSLLTSGTINFIVQNVIKVNDSLIQIFALTSLLGLEVELEYQMLSCRRRLDAAKVLYGYLSHELRVLEIQKNISQKIQSKLTKQQREILLREQLEQIKKELGEFDSTESAIENLKTKLKEAHLPESIAKEINKELNRLSQLHPTASDYQILRSYIEFVSELPWKLHTHDNLDLTHARKILDTDHFDLDEIKDRIIEQLVVLKLNPKSNAPILCFVGPPGVGKTSLGESIARALGRKFERLSLGGLHDEAELRGHRRTYIGAMPGRILKSIHRSGVKNPLLMLDEIDKLGRDFRGDPGAALMEILDPAQNNSFRDNYLDMPFDLSKVFFITTANTIETISSPLLDRMEVMRLSGYTENEKLEIAKRYLVPKNIKETGLSKRQISFEDKAILKIVRRYTREAGVRELGRSLSQVCRKVAVKIDTREVESMVISKSNVGDYLGAEKFFMEQARKKLKPGVAVGLAWTQAGGDVLFIESTLLPGGKGVKLTGQLGEVMKESALAAQSFIWSHADDFSLEKNLFVNFGLHMHIPEGAIPKDGPSAGITMATSLASVYMRKPMRDDLVMTGELTLTGLVLPVGGIKEKLLAAHRAGYKHVILPKENLKDLKNLPENLKQDLAFHLVENLNQVFELAFTKNISEVSQAG